jgi:hypothetical protein
MASDRKAIKPKLQGMQSEWVLHYLADPRRNATEAARLAGYKNPEQSGWENLHNPKIQEYIRDHFLNMHMTAEEVTARISEVASTLYAAYLRYDEVTGDLAVDLRRLLDDGLGHLIKGITYVRTGQDSATQVVEFFDAYKAKIDMGRIHGLFGAKGDEESPLHTVGMTLDEWRAESERRRQQAAKTAALFEDKNADLGTKD